MQNALDALAILTDDIIVVLHQPPSVSLMWLVVMIMTI